MYAEAAVVRELVECTDTFLFDCDGVLWHGDALLEGIVHMLTELRAAGKKLIFVTNNASKTRRQYAEKLTKMGVQASKEEVYCSAYGAAAFLNRVKFAKRAFVIGMEGLEEELRGVGIEVSGGSKYPIRDLTLQEASEVELEEDVGAIVIGLDTRLTYGKVAHAACYLRKDPDCLFVATNPDSSVNTANGRILPGAGAGIAAVQVASGRSPVVVGKPSPFLLDLILEEHSFDKDRTVMVGDRIDTDILFGKRGELKTVLVMSGVTSEEDLQELLEKGGEIMPDYILKSAAALVAGY